MGKGCDVSLESFQQFHCDKSLDPNHDIERAILRSHYRAMIIIIVAAQKRGDLDGFDPCARNALTAITEKLNLLARDTWKLEDHALVTAWESVIPASFAVTDASPQLPETYVNAALADMAKFGKWHVDDWSQIAAIAKAPNATGWSYAFVSKLREELKTNEPMRKIYHTHLLVGTQKTLDNAFAVLDGLLKTIHREVVELREEHADHRAENAAGHQETQELITQYFSENPSAAALNDDEKSLLIGKLQGEVKMLRSENKLTEIHLTKFLKIALPKISIDDGRLMESLPDLLQLILKKPAEEFVSQRSPNETPEFLKALQREVQGFLDDLKIDEARAALKRERVLHADRLRDADMDQAGFLEQEALIELKSLNTQRAIDLYQQASTRVRLHNLREAWRLLMEAAKVAYKRGKTHG